MRLAKQNSLFKYTISIHNRVLTKEKHIFNCSVTTEDISMHSDFSQNQNQNQFLDILLKVQKAEVKVLALIGLEARRRDRTDT